MRARTLVAIVGIPAFAVFMGLTAPASFIGARARDESQGRVHFDDARGTLWSGSMRALVESPGGPIAFERIAWRLVPARLMEGRLAFDVSVDSPDARASVQVLRGWSEWEARNGSAHIDARLLPAFSPLMAAWRPEGAISITADDVRWDERQLHGPVTIEWRDAGVALSEVKPLGGYRLALQGLGATAKIALTTLAGPLEMSGSGEWKLPREVVFTGEARAQGASAAALEPLLNLMGPKRPDAARSIEVRIR